MSVPMRGPGTERPVGAAKSGKPDRAKGSRHPACPDGQPREREEPSSQAKPFSISKQVVVEAYKRVKANGGAAGVDAQGIEAFERDLKNNLYKIWNRMSSGTYFPPPVRSVGIPKKDGGERRLGIPTVTANCGTVQYAFGVRRGNASLPPLGRPAAADSLRASSSGRSPVYLRGGPARTVALPEDFTDRGLAPAVRPLSAEILAELAATIRALGRK